MLRDSRGTLITGSMLSVTGDKVLRRIKIIGIQITSVSRYGGRKVDYCLSGHIETTEAGDWNMIEMLRHLFD